MADQDTERYTFDKDNKTIYKVDLKGKPDKNGMVWELLEQPQEDSDSTPVTFKDYHMVTLQNVDPSQPTSLYLIGKQYFI